jgi:hypothetical protein
MTKIGEMYDQTIIMRNAQHNIPLAACDEKKVVMGFVGMAAGRDKLD